MSPERARLLDLLAVERYMPSPRPPEMSPRVPDALPEITPEHAEQNLAILAAAVEGDVVVARRFGGAA